ncbi:MAG: tetratricopeptide repeat protein, partial [Candidatus Thorarchaeota archaeon]
MQIVEIYLAKSDITNSEQIDALILKGTILVNGGNYSEALELSRGLLQTSQEYENHYAEIDCLIVMNEALRRSGKLDDSLEIIEAAENVLKKIGQEREVESVKREASLLYHKGVVHRLKGELEESLVLQEKCLKLAEGIDEKCQVALSLHGKGIIYQLKGNPDQALEYYQQSLGINKQIGCTYFIAHTLNNIAVLFDQQGDTNKALEYQLQSAEAHKASGNQIAYANSLNNLGVYYHHRGYLDKAMEYFEQSLTMREDGGSDAEIACSMDNIGHIYLDRGDLDLALKCQIRGMKLRQGVGDKGILAASLHKIGSIYHRKGDLELAINHLQQSLDIRLKIGNRVRTSNVLFSLIKACIDNADIKQAETYLGTLKEIEEKEQNKRVTRKCQVAEALVLKTSNRVRDRGKSELLLKETLDDDILDHDVIIVALLNLCDLLLTELRASGELSVLTEVNFIVERLQHIAETQNSYWLLAETYILQSKLALLEFKLDDARALLNQAQAYVDEKGLGLIAEKISNSHDAMLIRLDRWNEFSQRDASMEERVQLSDLDDMVGEMVKGRWTDSSIPDEDPVSVLILDESGLCLFSKTYSEVALNQDLVGAFLSAFEMFCDELFSQSFDRAKFGKYTLILEISNPLIVCYVFKG